ncbi:histidine phosphatase family protein [Aquibium sp. A9E412]|uniref:histidine phosphatase family protein n=1 Tax=Aquibium sp. A9E412 TaxID=2976767 RepID=UPI0025B0612E|nr:histidine phosphatase family protein [Aquibium sp. A9E412]MDN2566783.1 histidine phosphatase family protein [Aquibium sp. A9E412]
MLRLCLVTLALLTPLPAMATEAGWALLRAGGQVVLMRHAKTFGGGDPATVDVEDCRTQSNLSERGRLQARRMGALIAARAAPTERALASRYCRTLETAELVFGESRVEPFAPLDPLPDDAAARSAALAEIRGVVDAYSGRGNLFLVTHLSTIEALVGAPAREGEAVIVRPAADGLGVMARIVFN